MGLVNEIGKLGNHATNLTNKRKSSALWAENMFQLSSLVCTIIEGFGFNLKIVFIQPPAMRVG